MRLNIAILTIVLLAAATACGGNGRTVRAPVPAPGAGTTPVWFAGLPGLPQDDPAPAALRTASAYQFTQADLHDASGATMNGAQLSIDQPGLSYAILGVNTDGQFPPSVTLSGTMHGIWIGVSDYAHGIWKWVDGPRESAGVISLPAAGTLSPGGMIYIALVCPLIAPDDQAWASISVELQIDPLPEWNLLVWIAGDNDLAQYAADNLNAMETVGSTDDLRILAGFDIDPALAPGISGLNQVGFIKVVKNSNAFEIITDGDDANELIDRAGYNSADPANLAQFISWVKTNFPAKHNALILWDHGDGWLPGVKGASTLPDFKPRRQASGILGDYTDGGLVLTDNTGVAQGLSGLHFDLLCFDACNMGQIEALYDFRGTADWVCASEALVPATGYPYAAILTAWNLALPATPQAVARIFADQTVAYYNGGDEYICQAVFDTSQLDALAVALADVADAVAANATIEGPLVQAAMAATFQPELSDGERDLHGFLQSYLGLTGNAAIQSKLGAAIDACNDYVTDFKQYALPATSGIAAYLPNIPFFNQLYQDGYASRAFNTATGWLDMLQATGVPQGDGTGVSLYWMPGERIEVAWSDTNADIDLALFDPAGNFGAPFDPLDLLDSVQFSAESEASGDDLEWGQLKAGALPGVYYVIVAHNAYNGGPPPANYEVSVKLYDNKGELKSDMGICTVGYLTYVNYATLEYTGP